MNIKAIIDEGYRIHNTTPKSLHPKYKLQHFEPITSGQYPIFNKYPKFIVNYQVPYQLKQ